MNLAVYNDATPRVKAITYSKINETESWLKSNIKLNSAMHQHFLAAIEQFKKDPSQFEALPVAPQIPDGSPIGGY